MESARIGVDRPICFLHLPKTGGTSLSSAIGKLYAPDRIFSHHSHLTVDYLASVADQLHAPGFITGHPGAGVARYLQGKADVITLLRRPNAQAVSHYLHVRSIPETPGHAEANSLSLTDYFRKHPKHLTSQATYLAAAISEDGDFDHCDASQHITAVLDYLSAIAFVGVLDRIDDCIKILSHTIGSEYLNWTPTINTASSRGVSDKYKESLIKEYNVLQSDPKLAPLIGLESMVYAKASALLNRDIESLGAAPPLAHDPMRPTHAAAARFSSRAGHLDHDQLHCPLGGARGHLIFGPYDYLKPGTYEVEFLFTLQGVPLKNKGKLKLEVAADAKRLLASRSLGARAALKRERTLTFHSKDPAAALEFRIGGWGFDGGELIFDGVWIRRLD